MLAVSIGVSSAFSPLHGSTRMTAPRVTTADGGSFKLLICDQAKIETRMQGAVADYGMYVSPAAPLVVTKESATSVGKKYARKGFVSLVVGTHSSCAYHH